MSAPNWANQTIWTGDNLAIMRGMNSGSVDLIYLDPPFNSNRNYEAPIGSKAAGAAFKDTWSLQDVDLAWHGEIAEAEPSLYSIIDAAGLSHSKGMKAYLIMMAVRLLEMRRLLSDTGSIYLHCDPTASHYLKTLMDAIFGAQCFRTEIVWKRTGAHSDTRQGRNQHGRVHDLILYYSRSECWTWNAIHTPYDPEYVRSFYRHVEPETNRRYCLDNITGPGGAAKGNPAYDVMGITRYWRYSEERMAALIAEGRIVQVKPGAVPRYKRYLDEMPGVPLQDLWADLPPIGSRAKERVGYPTQKPLTLLDRIIRASSNDGEVVLDPFCGCATACVAAEKLERQWIGIDISPKAADLVRSRLQNEVGMFWQGAHREDVPARTDQGSLPRYNADENKRYLYGQQEGKCNGCLTLFPYRNLDVDHVVSQKQGGGHHLDNLQLLCGACNSTKGTGTHEALVAKLTQEGIRA